MDQAKLDGKPPKRAWFVSGVPLPTNIYPWHWKGWLWAAFMIACTLAGVFGSKWLAQTHHPLAAWAWGIFSVLLFIRNWRIAAENTTRL
jgi:hypothetical protein